MVIVRKAVIFFILLIFTAGICTAQILVNYVDIGDEDMDYTKYIENTESEDTFLRIGLNQKKGTFNISYLTDPRTRHYEPLLNRDNYSTSFFSVLYDDTVYKPASQNQFKKRIGKQHGHPYLEFNSSQMIIRQIFAPIKTENSKVTNGIMMIIMIRNKTNKNANIGLRMLLDTSLGEAKGRVPFITNNKLILREDLIKGNGEDLFWISRGDTVSLMGSIGNPNGQKVRQPDFIHFASWEKLKNAKWAIKYKKNRSFNNLPYSINDSAVCYYFLPKAVAPAETIAFTIYLSTDDPGWYKYQPPLPEIPVFPDTMAEITEYEEEFTDSTDEFIRVFEMEYVRIYEQEQMYEYETGPISVTYNENDAIDIETLYYFHEKINSFLEGEIELDEDELLKIERSLQKLEYTEMISE